MTGVSPMTSLDDLLTPVSSLMSNDLSCTDVDPPASVEEKRKSNFDEVEKEICDVVDDMCNLTGPVFINRDARGEGIELYTSKGHRIPPCLNSENIEVTSDKYLELLLQQLDKLAECQGASEPIETYEGNLLIPDMHTQPQWIEYKGLPQYQYSMTNIPVNIDPNRKKSFLLPILNAIGYYDSNCGDDSEIISKHQVEALGVYLERTCSNGALCTYRYFYPNVEQAGPIALSQVTCFLLSGGLGLFSRSRKIGKALLESIIVTTVPQINKETSKKKTRNYALHSPLVNDKGTYSQNMCICCLMVAQFRTQIDAASELAVHQNGEVDYALLGLKHNDDTAESYLEFNCFVPVIEMTGSKKLYLKETLDVFKQYKVIRNPDDDHTWLVMENDKVPQS